MNDVTDPGIAAARSDVLARIAAAAKSTGRDPASVALVAVSKTQPDDRIEAMLSTGQRVFGENRVQEAEGRCLMTCEELDAAAKKSPVYRALGQ